MQSAIIWNWLLTLTQIGERYHGGRLVDGRVQFYRAQSGRPACRTGNRGCGCHRLSWTLLPAPSARCRRTLSELVSAGTLESCTQPYQPAFTRRSAVTSKPCDAPYYSTVQKMFLDCKAIKPLHVGGDHVSSKLLKCWRQYALSSKIGCQLKSL